jgi:hypothetical protein
MIEQDHPWHQRFARFSLLEAQHGLLDDSEDMLSAIQWNAKLKESGLMIKGNRLRYQDGVKRKRLPPKRLFMATQAKIPEPSFPPPLDDVSVDSEFYESPAIEAIDSDREDLASAAENQTAELPTRSRRYGVGKEIGYAVYVHRDYEDRLGSIVEWAKRHLPEHYIYHVVKINLRNDSVSFIQCPDFDTEHEPAITAIVVVNASGQMQRRHTPSDPYIYHHKWLFVLDDYKGFDVAESRARSKHWINLSGIDRSRIGRKSFWEESVVPRLSKLLFPEEKLSESTKKSTTMPSPEGDWYPSADARRLLKLSTCGLAHLREAGKIEFKKVGRAFLYRVRVDETRET